MGKSERYLPNLKERIAALTMEQQLIIMDDIYTAIDNRLQVFERVNGGTKQ